MDHTYWHKQTLPEPLFPDLLWSQPENRQAAGKLLAIGGNLHSLSAPAEAYNQALKAGAGTVRVLLPNAVQKLLGKALPAAEFGSSTPSGSFSRAALGEWLEQAAWSDMVLLAGDFGRNSESSIVIESFVEKYKSALVLTKDAIDSFIPTPHKLTKRDQTTLVMSLAQLQKLATNLKFIPAITAGMDLLRLVDALHNLTDLYSLNIVVKHIDNILVAVGGQVSTTKLEQAFPIWRVSTAARASVWWMQNLQKPFDSLSTAVIAYLH